VTARISFRAKAENVYTPDGATVAYRIIRVPVLARRHCDMNAFRRHPKYGELANSDLFAGVLAKIRRDVFNCRDYRPFIRLDQLPAGVTVDESGFLATVSAEV
jgi:hypothetical protein